MSKSGELLLETALHRAAKDYPGGIAALAGIFGRNAHTLQNQLNPTQGYPPNIEILEEILSATKSPLILDAIGRLAGVIWLESGIDKQLGDAAMLERITTLSVKVGQLSQGVNDSLADGQVTPEELEQLERCARELAQAGHSVVENAKQYCPDFDKEVAR